MIPTPRPHDFQGDIDAIGRNAQVPVLLETVLLATGMGFAAIARVTETRWVTCCAADEIAFGLQPGGELEVESTLCHAVRQSESEIVIDDVQGDPLYCNHPTPAQYGFRSYISVPIHTQAEGFFGTLCAIDPEPRNLKTDRVLGMFRLFARLIGEALDADATLRQSEDAVLRERALAGAQERFIAILAHDLRNPLSVLGSGLRMIERRGPGGDIGEIVRLMKGAVHRMTDLSENLLEQARIRQGDGIVIEKDRDEGLEPLLRQLFAEVEAVSPEREIVATVDLPVPVFCDRPRIAQLVANLLGNAVTHGDADGAIHINAGLEGDVLTISVANRGQPIPPAQLPHLFAPFQRGDVPGDRKGLGLGLYIASEIARAHGGTLEAGFEDGWTRFTFTMPDAL